MACVFTRILALWFLGLSIPLVQDGSVTDFNIYDQPSQWCNSVIAHSYAPFTELELGDQVIVQNTMEFYEVVSKEVVSYTEWFGGAYYKTSDLWLQTCFENGVLLVKLEQVERQDK